MATPTVVRQLRRHQDSKDRRHCKMKSSAAMFAFLALILTALVQADLATQTAEMRAKLKASKSALADLVEEANAKGPEFAKCTTEAAAKDKVFTAAKKAVKACQTKAVNALKTPPCPTDDVACQTRNDASKVKNEAITVQCMKKAINSVDSVVAKLSLDIFKCVQSTSKNFTPLPTARWKFPWKLAGQALVGTIKNWDKIKEG